jgi:hypothetical protein
MGGVDAITPLERQVGLTARSDKPAKSTNRPVGEAGLGLPGRCGRASACGLVRPGVPGRSSGRGSACGLVRPGVPGRSSGRASACGPVRAAIGPAGWSGRVCRAGLAGGHRPAGPVRAAIGPAGWSADRGSIRGDGRGLLHRREARGRPPTANGPLRLIPGGALRTIVSGPYSTAQHRHAGLARACAVTQSTLLR